MNAPSRAPTVTAHPLGGIVVEIPGLRLVSEANSRGHTIAKADRIATQRSAVTSTLRVMGGAAPPLPCRVAITRIAPESHEDTAEWVRATRRHTLVWTRTDGVVWVGPIARGGEIFEELLHLAPRHLFTALDPITDSNFTPVRAQVILTLPAALYTALSLDQRQSLQSPLKGHDAAWAIEGDRVETAPMEKHGALHRALLRAVRAAGLWPLLQQRDPATRLDQAEDDTEELAA